MEIGWSTMNTPLDPTPIELARALEEAEGQQALSRFAVDRIDREGQAASADVEALPASEADEALEMASRALEAISPRSR